MKSIGIVGGAGRGMMTAATAAALLAGMGISEPVRSAGVKTRQRPKRARKQADRSRKEFLLKGIRP